MKKILATITAVLMIAVMSVSVFAAGTNIAVNATVNAPFCSGWENAAAINDGAYPETSMSADGYTHYGSWGSATDNFETISYSWESEVTVDSIGLYFWRDTADRATWLAGGGINYPATYTVQYWNGTEYVDVANASGLGVDGDVMNVTTFDAVTTTSIQITMCKFTAEEEVEGIDYAGHGLGIYEFEVYEAGSETEDPAEDPAEAPQTGFATAILAVAAVVSGAYIVTKKH